MLVKGLGMGNEAMVHYSDEVIEHIARMNERMNDLKFSFSMPGFL